MPNIGKDDHPKLWSLIFVLIIALTFCCFVMGQGLNSGTSVFLAGQGYGASLAGVLALVFSIAAALARLFVGPVIDNGKCSLVIIAGIAILIAGTALSAVVQGIPLFTISRLLQGVGFGAATTAASTAAASVLPQERLPGFHFDSVCAGAWQSLPFTFIACVEGDYKPCKPNQGKADIEVR